MTRSCIVCGHTIIRRPNEAAATYATRTCCSRTCAGKRKGKTKLELPDRYCEHCNKLLTQRPDERPNKFRIRKYCNRACSEASRAHNPTRTRGRAGQRSDRDVQFSRAALMPTDVKDLGRKREYPRVQPLGEPCPIHPSNTIGAWGKCPACEAGGRWAKRQRETAFRPHHEGGR